MPLVESPHKDMLTALMLSRFTPSKVVKKGTIIGTICCTSLQGLMKRYHLLSSSPSQCSILKLHCLRQSPMTSPSRPDRMESHLWADRTNPQNGCKNTTNDRRSGKNTHTYTHAHSTSQPNHIMLKRSESLMASLSV